jgi:hypothetical protein
VSHRAARAVLGGVLLAATLTGCASQTETYCDTLADRREELTDLAVRSDEPGTEVLEETLAIWRDLHDEAPDDIADEWSTLVFGLEGLVDAFDAAGTDPGEFDPASPPPGVSDAEADRLQDAAAELASPRVATAGEAVEQHARDVCDVDLGLTGGAG